uniref:Uncharacterized protein n=1 Tax=Marseillevirus LCMAC201 TaxID=2506605 RepID=A0A481YXZ8_9VIRU|nr:MAG: hypothetical protein LCMAC201_02460 [Marseillevirus LCMAC201]
MSLIPQKLAIYYGWPNTVKDWTVAGAASVFKDYDLVVFGAGLEDSGHGDHQNTDDIISHTDMSSTECYGYVTVQTSQSANETKIDNWDAMGVAGIFCDEFGYDYGTKRSEQNDLVDYIHTKSLKAFVNAWKPEDALGNEQVSPNNPQGTAHKLNTTDWYLCESYAVKDNDYDDTDTDTDGHPDWKEKADKLVADYSGDIQVACIGTTGTSSAGFTQAKADYSYYATCMYGFDAWGWGEKNYSSAGGPGSLDFRTRKAVPEGTSLHGSVVKTGDVFEKNTNVGFHIDTDAHTVSDRLD